MPVPSAISSAIRAPADAPCWCSAQAAELTSWSITTGRCTRAEIRAGTSASRQARCGANITRCRSWLTNPATASPTAETVLGGGEFA